MIEGNRMRWEPLSGQNAEPTNGGFGTRNTDLASIYNQNKLRLYRFALRMLGNEEEAGDIVQAVFLRLLEKIDSIDSPEKIPCWLFQVARNQCYDKLQTRKRDTVAQSVLLERQSDLEPESDNLDVAHIVHRGLSRLSPELREILILREFQEFSYREIAEIISVNESTVKFRLFTARRTLCDLLKPSMKGA
jgi:RNA polymerase sigma factor (sigma-70 family)